MSDNNEQKYFGEKPEDQEYFVKMAHKWYGWGTPVGLGFFIISIGIFIFLLSQSGIL